MSLAWGFLACNFLGASVAIFTNDIMQGVGTTCALAGFLSAFIALVNWDVPTGGGE